jgi:phage tail sheath gpL-like
MAVDASAVARVVGISTAFKPAQNGNVIYLPQRIAVFAQGASGANYSLTKRRVLSSAEAGSVYGFGSPAHLIVDQLLPANGDGVDTIPVTIYPLADAPSSVAASATITPSGTQTKSAAYQVVINNIASAQFVVAANATVTQILAAAYTAILAQLKMPMVPGFTYGTVTSTPGTNTGNGTVTVLSVVGGGKPMAGAWKLTLNTVVANGGVFTLTDPNGVVVSTTVTMTPGAGGATVIAIGGLQFTITDGSTDFALSDSFTINVPATALTLVSKWKGLSANALSVSVVGDSLGVTFTIAQPSGGLINPPLPTALAQMGNVWETLVLNALNIDDTTRLDEINVVGEGRWGTTTKKPLIALTGNTLATEAAATAVSSTRQTDRINGQLVSPGSSDLPFVVAARELARIAVVANNNPACDYGSQSADGLTPGADGVQWDYPTRDAAVKAGSSTVEVRDSVVTLGDTVTFYAPTGEIPPAYRYVCDIVKLQNIIFNINLIFAQPDWDGAPLIPDTDPTENEKAKQPKMAKAAVATLLDALGMKALISDVATSKKKIISVINGSNAKRLDLTVPVKLSGNTNIISIDLQFSFYFGGSAQAA